MNFDICQYECFALYFENKKQGDIFTTQLKDINSLKSLYCSPRCDAYFRNKGFGNWYDDFIDWGTFCTV